MLDKFEQYIQAEQLFLPHDRLLLAVSGGIDSVCLADLCNRCDYDFAIAHCNFQLRGKESEADAQFVEKFASRYKVPFFQTTFDTLTIAKKEKKGIQEMARDLRYEWLQQVATNESFDCIATAHHLNDAIETFLFNGGRGGGIRAFRGILPKQNNVFRPLLFATKKEIEVYAQQYNLEWREDRSNEKEDYTRNYIRHQILPLWKTVHPNLEENMSKSFVYLRETAQLQHWAIENIQKEVGKTEKEELQIDLEKLCQFPACKTILFEWLSPLGFTSSDVDQMMSSQTGSQFYSTSHVALKNRTVLFIRKRVSLVLQQYLLNRDFTSLDLGNGSLKATLLSSDNLVFENSSNVAYFDLAKLQFPLTLRHWQAGDRFQPLGMKGRHKKVQDLFSDQKVSRWEKSSIWLLLSGETIAWVVGYRSSEAFKVQEKTKQVYRLEFLSESPDLG